ncbi:MAG: FimV/HubP family polar landmark protein [Gammaproteobacteria bacterium]
MLKLILFLIFSFSINVFADINLSSPKLSLNQSGERVIEFKIQDGKVEDSDIFLNEYKSDEALKNDYISYTLLENFNSYQLFSIILKNEYESNYFSFKLILKDSLAKDIFIFLPSKINNTIAQNEQARVYKPQPQKIKTQIKEQNPEQEKAKPKNIAKKNKVIKASEISTIWSIASNIQKEETNASIYQIMWSIYLGNKDAFIDENINLVRNDKDLIIPSSSKIATTSDSEARSSILAMNKSFSVSIAPALKSLLVLTAPKIEEKPKPIESSFTDIREKKEAINQKNEITDDPKDFIEQNTKQLEVALDSRVIKDLSEKVESIEEIKTVNNFGIRELLFVAIISILSGILIALIYIQLQSRRIKNIQYDFEEAADTKESVRGLPKGLSIKNNEEEQQLDLANTYFEMNDIENCRNVLNDLIKNTSNLEIKMSAQNLLEKL